MSILRYKPMQDGCAVSCEDGEFVAYVTHCALLEKMQERAIAAEKALAERDNQNPYAYEYWFQNPDGDDIVKLLTTNKSYAETHENKPLFEQPKGDNEKLLNMLLSTVKVEAGATVVDKFEALQRHWYLTARDSSKADKDKKIEIYGDPTWNDFESISDLPEVFEAMQNFSHDSTGDNGICVVRAIVNAIERQTDYEYLRDDGIEYLISALGVDPDGDEAEPYLLVRFLKEFTDNFITPNGVKWVDDEWGGKDDTLPGYRVTAIKNLPEGMGLFPLEPTREMYIQMEEAVDHYNKHAFQPGDEAGMYIYKLNLAKVIYHSLIGVETPYAAQVSQNPHIHQLIAALKQYTQDDSIGAIACISRLELEQAIEILDNISQ